jgi:hypothetical protein
VNCEILVGFLCLPRWETGKKELRSVVFCDDSSQSLGVLLFIVYRQEIGETVGASL